MTKTSPPGTTRLSQLAIPWAPGPSKAPTDVEFSPLKGRMEALEGDFPRPHLRKALRMRLCRRDRGDRAAELEEGEVGG